MRQNLLALALVLATSCCSKAKPEPVSPAPVTSSSAAKLVTAKKGAATLSVVNATDKDTTAYFAFGSDSVVLPSAWSSFCTAASTLNCSFVLTAQTAHKLPLGGNYANVTVAFDSPVGCGATKAEANLNNPAWYDTLDVSLVDGYSNNVSIQTDLMDAGGTMLGPPNGKTGNEKVFGLFPLGCDICTERQNPPCGISKGKEGCKAGTQYKPDVFCQYQGKVLGGGAGATIYLNK